MRRIAIFCALFAAIVATAAAQTKYGVTVTADKTTDFKAIRSYVWESGWETPNRTVHAMIVAAIDRELKALGLEKKTAGPSDAVVKYATLRRVDITADPKAALGSSTHQEVGTLQILMLQPGAAKELLRLRVDSPIEVDASKMEAQIDAIVKDMFARYPTRTVKK